MTDLDARLIHKTDQLQAQLAAVVGQVRYHRPACEARHLGACVGPDVWEWLRRLDRYEALQLLGAALGQLSTQPAPVQERTPA